LKRKFKEELDGDEPIKAREKERKRQSRWGPQELKVEPKIEPNDAESLPPPPFDDHTVLARSSFLSRITSADPQILTYAVRVFGTTDLTEDQWKQCMDQVKVTIHIVRQLMGRVTSALTIGSDLTGPT